VNCLFDLNLEVNSVGKVRVEREILVTFPCVHHYGLPGLRSSEVVAPLTVTDRYLS
jgi:hypothetical protein